MADKLNRSNMEVRCAAILLFLVNFSLFIGQNFADEILGCGGFIKSHADIDFSKVEIKLLTKQGSLKDKTDCSPSNGYYFLPVYDKGEYVLKISPPPGWSFEPESVELNFDGKTDICSQGKDVNFSFKGFGITGKVALAGHVGGARDVTVELKSEDGTDIRRTTTDINGVFSFTPIIPGKYTIKASHNVWYFSKSEYSVTVQTGNTELPPNSLEVSGFDVIGKVLTSGQSFTNIDVLLYREKGLKLSSHCQQGNLPQVASENAKYENAPICSTSIDKNGEYVFKGVASGKYLAKPIVPNKDLKLHIQPSFVEFAVGKDTLVLKDNFEITGFGLSGKVLLDEHGRGVPEAYIRLNGELVATTDSQGNYALENVKAGTYTIKVEAENLQFTDQVVKVSLANPHLPNIIVSAFKVCGNVISEKSYTVGISKHGSTFYKPVSTYSKTGEWCEFLPNGKYTAEVLTTEEDKTNGIQFFPLKQSIVVNSSPVSGIIFSQLRATVEGEVKCMADSGKNCKNIELTLHALDANGKATGQTFVTTASNGKYVFADVLPGHYEITIPTSNLCWDKTSQKMNIMSASEKVPAFTHLGYEISVISSHRVKMHCSHKLAKESTDSIEMMSGVNTFCVLKAGDYDMSLEGCHTYDQNLPKSFSTNDANPIIITAVAHKVGVRILSTEQNVDRFKVMQEGKSGVQAIYFENELHKVDGYHSYRYNLFLQPEESVTFTPQSDLMLFKPESKEIVGGNDCIDVAFSFIATRGLIIEGKIVPAISDVKVTLSFPKNSELTELETVTAKNGSFRFGPLDSSLQVDLKAEKESYVFSEFDKTKNLFTAHKLCEIIATVTDESGNKLSGVLLSLSGAESYRKNLVTSEDGTIKFHSLSPSQYYLRPMMKEYKFNPNSKMIDIKDGETVKVQLSGKRVAYSLFGTVTSLNGDPFPNVVIEAVADEACMHHEEESTSENNGQYRIRGLQPGCTYTVMPKVGEANANVERSIPESRTIKIEGADVKNVNLIAISPFGFVDVIARVHASSNDHYKTLRIQMYRKGSADSPIYSQRVETPLNPKSRYNPGIMVFFPRIPLDGKTYFVELKTSISDKMYKYELPVAQFVANTSSVYVELNFYPELKATEGDLNQNSISALILVALVAIAFFKQDLAMDCLNFVVSRFNTITQDIMDRQNKKREVKHTEAINYKEIEQIAEGINAVKKKKAKKI